MLASLEGHWAGLASDWEKWDLAPPAEKLEFRLGVFPQTGSMQPYSQENPAGYMRMRCYSLFPDPSSTTMGPYSSSTTKVPHAAAPNPDTFPRPATNQPAPYAAPTASAPYDSTSSWLPTNYENNLFVCSIFSQPPNTGDSL